MTLSRLDGLAQIRAAEITVRRASLQNFPPGEQRTRRLRWIAVVVSAALDCARHCRQQETSELDSPVAIERDGKAYSGKFLC